jgi:hypothetical protein
MLGFYVVNAVLTPKGPSVGIPCDVYGFFTSVSDPIRTIEFLEVIKFELLRFGFLAFGLGTPESDLGPFFSEDERTYLNSFIGC